MKYKIIEKAWCLNPSNLSEPWFHSTDIIYYGTRGVAKSLAIGDNDAGETLNGDDISFLNIRVSRAKNYDKIEYFGKIIKRYEIKNYIREFNITQLPKDKKYYIQDRRSYVGNAVLWHGINGNGYVTDLKYAQKFTWGKVQTFNLRETDIIWESEHVEGAVREYVDSQGLDWNNSL